jgi:hypothetical protein
MARVPLYTELTFDTREQFPGNVEDVNLKSKVRRENQHRIKVIRASTDLRNEDLSFSQANVIGPHFSTENTEPNTIKPLQSDLEIDPDFQQVPVLIRPNSSDTVKLENYKQHLNQEQQVSHFTPGTRKKIAHLEIEIKYLRSLLSKEFDVDCLNFISEVITDFFIKSPRLSSNGKTCSLYTDTMARARMPTFGAKRTNKFCSSDNDSDDGSRL